jgi:hypothetical protein
MEGKIVWILRKRMIEYAKKEKTNAYRKIMNIGHDKSMYIQEISPIWTG